MRTRTVYNWKIVAAALLYSLVVLLPSLRIFLKLDLPNLYLTYLLLSVGVFLSIRWIANLKIRTEAFWLIFITMTIAAAYFVYPIVSLGKNPGSTGDNAFILAAQSFLSGGTLYDVSISPKEPISPGPAWVIFNSPFVLFNAYWLFGASYISLAVGFLRKTKGNHFASVFCLLFTSSMVFVELLINGHDLLPLSAALFAVHLLISYYLRRDMNFLLLIFISILLGVVASSRIIFGFLPLMYFLLLRKSHFKSSLILLVISSSVYCFFNIFYYLVNDYFQPIHLISKAFNMFGGIYLLLLFLAVLVGLFVIYKRVEVEKYALNLSVLAVLLLLTLPLAYADLVQTEFDFRSWEGANYLIIPLPFLVFDFINYIESKFQIEKLTKN
jgi:hypothetical protein